MSAICGSCGGGITVNPAPIVDQKILSEAIEFEHIEIVNGQPVYKPKAIIKAKIEFK